MSPAPSGHTQPASSMLALQVDWQTIDSAQANRSRQPGRWLQSLKGALHVSTTQAPLLHATVAALGRLPHTLPQPPQFLGLVVVEVSQPLAVSPSQSLKFARHAV